MAASHLECEDVIGVVAAIFAVSSPARSVTSLVVGRGLTHFQYKSVMIV